MDKKVVGIGLNIQKILPYVDFGKVYEFLAEMDEADEALQLAHAAGLYDGVSWRDCLKRAGYAGWANFVIDLSSECAFAALDIEGVEYIGYMASYPWEVREYDPLTKEDCHKRMAGVIKTIVREESVCQIESAIEELTAQVAFVISEKNEKRPAHRFHPGQRVFDRDCGDYGVVLHYASSSTVLIDYDSGWGSDTKVAEANEADLELA